MKPILTFLFSMLLITACSDDDNQIVFEKNQVLFQYQYINYAWVYQRDGWYIDANSKVWSFDKPQTWNEINSDTKLIEESKLSENLLNCSVSSLIVDSVQLLKYTKMINSAAKGTLTTPVSVMADYGIHKFVAYQYNPQSKTYKEILIYQWGDLEIKNQSEEAEKIRLWLESLMRK